MTSLSRSLHDASISPLSAWPGVLEYYRVHDWLPAGAPIVTLQEGNTPLIPAPRLAAEAGGGFELYLKYEGVNPTASFKDRGMTAAMTQALARGCEAGHLRQHGQHLRLRRRLRGPGRTALRGAAAPRQDRAGQAGAGPDVRRGDHRRCAAISTTRCGWCANWARSPASRWSTRSTRCASRARKPPRSKFATCWAARPTFISCRSAMPATSPPTGAVFRNITSTGSITSLPRMCGFQAAGAAPIVEGRPVADPQTIATAIRIGNPASWEGATDGGGGIQRLDRKRDGRGNPAAYALMARLEGLFVEPACAAPVAGLLRMGRQGLHSEGKRGDADPDRPWPQGSRYRHEPDIRSKPGGGARCRTRSRNSRLSLAGF